MSFGMKLKTLRTSKQITQDELARELGVKKHCISDWEIERSDPNIEQLIMVADYFELSIQELLELPLMIQPQLPLEQQNQYFNIYPKTEVEASLFSKVEHYQQEQLNQIAQLIQILKHF